MNTGVSNISKFIYTWILTFLVWLAFTSTFELSEVLVGLFISFLVSVFSYKSFTNTGLKMLSPIRVFNAFKYFFVFILALIQSNLHVAKIVLTPSLPINPGIVEFESKLTSDFARMILANSITLTPGTLSVDVIDNRFFIHWLEVETTDKQKAYEAIAKQFEDILIKIFE